MENVPWWEFNLEILPFQFKPWFEENEHVISVHILQSGWLVMMHVSLKQPGLELNDRCSVRCLFYKVHNSVTRTTSSVCYSSWGTSHKTRQTIWGKNIYKITLSYSIYFIISPYCCNKRALDCWYWQDWHTGIKSIVCNTNPVGEL